MGAHDKEFDSKKYKRKQEDYQSNEKQVKFVVNDVDNAPEDKENSENCHKKRSDTVTLE